MIRIAPHFQGGRPRFVGAHRPALRLPKFTRRSILMISQQPTDSDIMGITRKFLDWSEPALQTAVALLVEKYRRGQLVDLDKTVIAFPGSRAGRRFLEILVRYCEERTLVLIPPAIKTVGQLPELLYEPQRPFASDLVQLLAWVHALRSEGRRKLSRIMPALPDEDDVPRWLDLGRIFWQQHREMAAEGLNFQHVVDSGWQRSGLKEKNRWKLLGEIQRHYLDILDHFELWDMQTARLFAIEHRECRAEVDIVLVGASDMNRAFRLMLDQVADRVTAFIYAPSELADCFDRHGCIDPDAWADVEIELNDDCLELAEGPAEQAEAVVNWLAELDGRFRADEIAIGTPDPTAASQIQRRLNECNLSSRFVVGRKITESAPYRLLLALADYLDRGRFDEFAALVRHSDVSRWITERLDSPNGWLTQLDEYHAKHLPPRLGKWLGKEAESDQIRTIHEWIEELVRPLAQGRCKLADWGNPIIETIVNVYGERPLDRGDETDHYTLHAIRAIQQGLLEQKSAPAEITPSIAATQAIRMLLDQLSRADMAPPMDHDAIEMLGWLELPLDTASAMVVTSFNEGVVPTSMNSDLFLPNSLRKKLGMLDNKRRYARDAYALSMLAASRKELRLVVARRDAKGEPLTPSRLLFAASLREIAKRSGRFFQVADTAAPAVPQVNLDRDYSEFCIPRPDPELPVDSMSVTSFRSYIACPYRFYLRHVLRLESVDDSAEELNAPTFGNLVHDVLNVFGRSNLRDSNNADHIRSFLQDTLRKTMRSRFGRRPLAPVNVQAAQVLSRLEAFARWQADWRNQGWEIAYAESPEMVDTVTMQIGERSLALRGRVDRIDKNPQTGEWIVFDYKTSDTDSRPEQTHMRSGEWVDLQLPLYRRFASAMDIEGEVKLGYIVLPKDVDRTGERIAQWSEYDLEKADALTLEIAEKVLGGQFWPPADPAPDILTDYSVICQESAYEKHYAPAEAEA